MHHSTAISSATIPMRTATISMPRLWHSWILSASCQGEEGEGHTHGAALASLISHSLKGYLL
jgi:hypothetical protein